MKVLSKIRTLPILLLALVTTVALALAAEPAALWIDVPFIAQSRDGCGSASIAMVMKYWQQKEGETDISTANPDRIQAELFSPAAGGILASSMVKYFQASGYRVFAFQGEWGDLKQHLERGQPLIVGLKPSGRRGPFHYVVVTGIDSERGYIFLNDPAQQKMLRVSRGGFESEWSHTRNWTLLALPRIGD